MRKSKYCKKKIVTQLPLIVFLIVETKRIKSLCLQRQPATWRTRHMKMKPRIEVHKHTKPNYLDFWKTCGLKLEFLWGTDQIYFYTMFSSHVHIKGLFSTNLTKKVPVLIVSITQTY